MPWLRTGTVACTLNSTTVTGTSTGFVANARVGDAFLGPDGRWYEVANIASDTALSILPAYLGATVSAGSYALAPMQGYVKDSADQLRTLVNKFGTLAAAASINALAAVTGAAGKFPYFTAGDQMALATLSDYAKSGQNGDIKALLGMTTPLSVAQGGTGGTSPPYTRANSVGTVSQASGVPTGAIVERGSNANGEYVKYLDGTLICKQTFTGISVSTATGGNYLWAFTTATQTWTFPIAFVGAVPAVTGSEVSADVVFTAGNRGSLSSAEFRFFYSSSITGRGATLMATGRWF
jgi:hypothetical protein